MRIKIFYAVILTLAFLHASSQTVPDFFWSNNATGIGNTYGKFVKVTPAQPNVLNEVESPIFEMPGRGQGVMGLRVILHGADGGAAVYKESIGGPWVGQGGLGATIDMSLRIDTTDPLLGTSNAYGAPFFVTIGKNGGSNSGYYFGCAAGGGGSTGMAWIVPGADVSQYLTAYQSNTLLPYLYLGIAAGGGGGEILNANNIWGGNPGGVLNPHQNRITSAQASCPPNSIETAAGASILANYVTTGLNTCELNTISAYHQTFQVTVLGHDVLNAVAIGQEGGQPCEWVGGGTPTPNPGTSFGGGCGGLSMQGVAVAGGSGYTGGGAGSAFIGSIIGSVYGGGGGTGSWNWGSPGELSASATYGAGGGENFINPAYNGITTNGGGGTSTPASGYFEYQTIADDIPPVVHAKSYNVFLNASGTATISTADLMNDITDNDSVQFISISKTSFTCNDLGTNVVLVTASDFAGNSAEAYDTIVVKSSAPYAADQLHLVYGDPDTINVITGPYTLSQKDFPVYIDNCYDSTQLTYSWPATTFNCSQGGAQKVNLTVTTPDGVSSNYQVRFFVRSSFSQPIIYVDASATGANTGLTWHDALTNLQDALSLNCGGSSHKTIYVAQGTYYPDHGTTVTLGDRNATFIIPDSVQIYGGFVSGGDVFGNRNPAKYVVSLSGAIGTVPSSSYSYHVVTIPPTSANAYLEGVNIISGYANKTSTDHGGGVSITSTAQFPVNRATFVKCNFSNNYASSDGGGLYFGDIDATGYIQVQNCIFSHNTVGGTNYGGALAVDGNGEAQAQFTQANITNCAFSYNHAAYGGAVSLFGGASNIINCSFGFNSAIQGGALQVLNNTPDVYIYNTVMYYDTGTNFGYPPEISAITPCTVAYSDIQFGSSLGVWGNFYGINAGNNIDVNPQIAPFPRTNLQVLLSSPLRNKGNNAYNSTQFDLSNSARVQQDTVDIGAYEPSSVVYVAWDAPNGGDGNSWATALNNLDDALDTATFTGGTIGNTRQIWVKTGTYKPGRFQGTDQGRENTFNIQYAEKLYGGFAGNETEISQRNVATNPTILDGDIGTAGSSGDNAYHVVTFNGYSPLLDGFIIQNGRADNTNNFTMQNGGAIVDYSNAAALQAATPTIRNCVFRNNYAINGGAVSFTSVSTNYTATFMQCLFYNNTASTNGGVVYNQNSSSFSYSANATCNFINCTATNNTAQQFSGGFAFNLNEHGAGSCTSYFYNSIIWGNTAGGVASASESAGTNAGTQNFNSNLQGTNPMFVNASNPAGNDGLIFTADDGLKLQLSSTAINGGNNAYLHSSNANDSLYDVTGATRVQQQVVDMGVYENFGCLGYTGLYVDGSVLSGGNGGSWSSPFKYLQDALNVAQVCAEVDTVYIAQGTYYPCGTTDNVVSRDTAFYIGRKITVVGGYQQGGGQQNPNTYPTILDGNINTTANNDNTYHILNIYDLNSSDIVVLDGLAFTNAAATGGTGSYTIGGTSFSRSSGAAISAIGPVVIIHNCHFYNNAAAQGGGCIEDYAGSMIANNDVFENNSARYGAAIRTEPGVSLTANGNTFYHNQGASDGGAVSLYMGNNDESIFINNQFVQNTTVGNGAAATLDGGTSLIYNNTFYGNSATISAGALYFLPGGSSTLISLFNNVFYKNTATANVDFVAQNSSVTLAQGLNSLSSGANPIFLNEASLKGPDGIWGTKDDGLELQSTSPLINLGTNFVATSNTDLAGSPRVQLGIVDLGAFESASEVTHWYVNAHQDSLCGDGSSWATAFLQLQQALSVARAGDTIWVAGGVYTPASGASFNMKSDVQIYGGFNATETSLSQRNLGAGYNSILQGNGSNVILNDSVNSAAVLNGFVIENGTNAAGAGMRNFHSSPQINNCVFANNIAGLFGGGMSCSYSSPSLSNVIFYNNSVSGPSCAGGAMYCANGSNPLIRNCDFVNNSSTFNGGGVYCLANSVPAISNSAFTGNTAINTYPDFFSLTQNISHTLLQTGNADSGNIISSEAGMLDINKGAGIDGLWFTDDDGLQLAFNSNLINRGINDSVIAPNDITGATRVKNGVVDMGAYESSSYSYCDSATLNGIHILYVDGNQPASGDGYSWGTAFLTLNEALDKANYCHAFDTILVAGGIYYPTGYQDDTDRTQSFNIIRSGYAIIGGYPNGGGTRNAGINNTILSGDIGVADTNFDNSYHVLVFRNTDSTTNLDGFVITGGNASSAIGDANGNGGGAWFNGSGNGAYCKPRISNCVFTKNTAYYGGAVINDAMLSGNSSPSFTNCVFAQNTAFIYGAAIYNAAYYGGIDAPVITNCTFAQNAAGGLGGGIYDDCSLSGTVSSTLKNTIFWGNTAPGGALADQQLAGTGCLSTASYCLIQGGLPGSLVDGGHNHSTNPLFVDSTTAASTNGHWMTAIDGLNILVGSPAIQAGTPSGAPAVDIAGVLRTSPPDIGAYQNICNGTIYDTLNITACDSALSPTTNYWWTTGGLHYDTTITSKGCDTIFIVKVTLGHTASTSIAVASCSTYTSPSGRHTWNLSGLYSDTLSSVTGCDSILFITLSINPPPASPTITAGGNTTFCPGGQVKLTASAGSSYLWSTGATTQGIIVKTSGSYIVTVYNSSGCGAASAPVVVTASSNPIPTVTVSGPTTFCQGGNVKLTASPGSLYIWSNGATTRTITARTSDTYIVTVGFLPGGCSGSSAPVTVTANSLPGTMVSAGGATTFCQGGTVILAATTGIGYTYLWSKGQTTNSISATVSGGYRVTVTDANGCRAASAITRVTVHALPDATITASANELCNGDSVKLIARPGVSWNWSTGATSRVITVRTPDTYDVTVTSKFACSNISAPAVITDCGTAGKTDNSEFEVNNATPATSSNTFDVTVYPNPYTGQFHLKVLSSTAENINVKIYDITGKILEERREMPYGTDVILGSGYVAGVYIIETNQADRLKMTRVVKAE